MLRNVIQVSLTVLNVGKLSAILDLVHKSHPEPRILISDDPNVISKLTC